MTAQDRQALSISVGTTVVFALVGGVLAGDAVTSWYPSLRKSRLVLPLWAFLPVAVLYYLMCGVILFRLLARVAPRRERRAALTQLLTMMAANEGWNYLMFGRRSPRAGLTISLFGALRRADQPSATILMPYLAWLGYDLVYVYELWRLNR